MKSILLSLTLLSSCPILAETITIEQQSTLTQEHVQLGDGQKRSEVTSPCDEDDDDNLFEENDDLPPTEAPREISPFEAYMRECGVNVLLGYVSAKVWVEHQWKALIKNL